MFCVDASQDSANHFEPSAKAAMQGCPDDLTVTFGKLLASCTAALQQLATARRAAAQRHKLEALLEVMGMCSTS
jgi:hypothetical protein